MHRSTRFALLPCLVLSAIVFVAPALSEPGTAAPGAEAPPAAGQPGPEKVVPGQAPSGTAAQPTAEQSQPSGSEKAPPSGASQVSGYVFTAPPHLNINRIYRVNRATGEITACQFDRGEGIGTTKCFQSGEGAGPQVPGDYDLMASHMQNEGGVFRMNRKTGEVSVCYVLKDMTVCTPQAR